MGWPEFIAIFGAISGPFLMGLGWLVRYAFTRKDENARRFREELGLAEAEAQKTNEENFRRAEEMIRLTIENKYLQKEADRSDGEARRLARLLEDKRTGGGDG